MTTIHVQVRDAKADEMLFSEHLDIPDSENATEIIRGALTQAYLMTHGIKKPPREVLPLVKDAVISLYVDQKLSTEEIGRVYNCGKEAVSRFLRANGVPMRPQHRRRTEPTQQQRDAVLALVQVKATRNQIMAKTGLSEHHLRMVMLELGIRLPKGRRSGEQ
jgi:hypothetical protein